VRVVWRDAGEGPRFTPAVVEAGGRPVEPAEASWTKVVPPGWVTTDPVSRPAPSPPPAAADWFRAWMGAADEPADPPGPYADAFARGTPVGADAEAGPAERPLGPPLTRTALLLAALAAAGALNVFVGRKAWPEQWMLLAAAGALALGPPDGYLFVVPVLAAVAARAVLAARRAVRLLAPQPAGAQ
jgi:hypothetical protein